VNPASPAHAAPGRPSARNPARVECAITCPWSATPRVAAVQSSAYSSTPMWRLPAAAEQGLTLVHFSAQRKRFLWDRGCN